MVDHRVLNGRVIKIIYIIHIEWLLLFVSMDNSCHGCFAAQNLTERIKTILSTAEVEFFSEIKMIFI